MTELTLSDNNHSNGINKNIIISQNDEHSNMVKGPVRPSGIPRLSSAIPQKANNDCSIDDYNSKMKTCLSPSKLIYAKSPSQDTFLRDALISPTYTKRSSRDTFPFGHSVNTEPRPRVTAQSLKRHDRALSEEQQGRKSVESSFSEITNNSGSTGASNHVITSKIGSFANVRHKPGGGNVKIIEKKIDFSKVEARCGSKKNIKYKPGGGDVEIVNRKLEFSKVAEPKVNSLKNIKYQPHGGDVKIDDRKLEWNTNSKVGSLNNIKHRPGGGNVQIVNQQLPWLKYNKPNLPSEEIAKIHKNNSKGPSNEVTGSSSQSYSNSLCSEHSR